jgi:N-dimethylarginine dimethylaminohydrolase
MTTGYQSDVGKIELLVLKHPRQAFVSDELIEGQWRDLGYRTHPDLTRAAEEYDRLVDLLRGFDIDLRLLPEDPRVGLDSLYPRDAAIACNRGMILCNMGKAQRRNEPQVLAETLREMQVPILGGIRGEGTFEGGDAVWIDEGTLAVGRGYRTDDEGIAQLRELLGDCVDELVVVPLPHHRGPDDVFHLMSMLSPLDRDLALVYSPLLPVPFRELLLSRGIRLVEVPDAEFESMACNVLALAPRRCLMIAGNPQTRRRLEVAGVEVLEFEGREICLKGAGGPTCLTRPIRRA